MACLEKVILNASLKLGHTQNHPTCAQDERVMLCLLLHMCTGPALGGRKLDRADPRQGSIPRRVGGVGRGESLNDPSRSSAGP